MLLALVSKKLHARNLNKLCLRKNYIISSIVLEKTSILKTNYNVWMRSSQVKSQHSWVRSQHPPTQQDLRGGR
jgi:hypothetical protein